MKFVTTNLETERLILRKLRPEDSDALYAIFSDKQTLEYWGHAPYTQKQQAVTSIQEHLAFWDAGKSLCMAIEHKASAGLIGTISLFNFYEDSRRAEVGYILSRPHWGSGIMSEALVAILGYAFIDLNLNRLEADIDPGNAASARLLKKMGFQLEGLLRERWIVGDLVTDTELYGLLHSDYLGGKE